MAACLVFNKPAYVFQWISEKNTDFMRKFSSFAETCNQLTDTRFHLNILIATFFEQRNRHLIRKIAL